MEINTNTRVENNANTQVEKTQIHGWRKHKFMSGDNTNTNTNAYIMDWQRLNPIARKTLRSKFSCKLKSNADYRCTCHEEKNTNTKYQK